MPKRDKTPIKVYSMKSQPIILTPWFVLPMILTWLWNKLYNGIDVRYAEQVHDLTNKGHEIIYMPCHRSHMDYLY